jgi:phosphotransferase system IIB component
MKKLTLMLMAWVFALATNWVYAQEDATSILTKHIEVVGGFDNIKAVKSVKISQTVSTQGYDIQQKLTIIPNEAIKSETNAMGTISVVSVKGESGWQINPAVFGNETPVQLKSGMIKALKAQGDVIFSPLMDWKSYKSALVGSEKVNDEEAYKLNITIKENTEMTVFIGKTSFLILRTVLPGNEANYLDYINVKGFMLPTTIEMIARNGKMTITDRKFEINTVVDEGIFKMPSE